jgi:NAD(P)-dependent dehydrogenase (short-subunit alcohol dehydrogenase family)
MIAAGVEGRIVLIGSVNSFAAERNAAPYASSKGGRLLTRAAAVDLAQYGITVNMIAPGPITTPATQANFETDATKHVFARVLPGGSPGTPADVAAAAMFLASRESFITGTDLLVDGGMFARIMN